MVQHARRSFALVPALLFVAIPLLALAGLAGYSLLGNNPSLTDARRNVVHAMTVLQAADVLGQAMVDAESGQRGYLLTADPAYLNAYTAALPHIQDGIAGLQRLTNDDPDQQRRLLDLQSHVTTKLNELAATIAAMEGPGGFEAARGIVRTDLGLHSMEAVRADLGEIGLNEQKRLGTRLNELELAEHRNTEIFVGLSVLALATLIAGGVLLSRAHNRLFRTERTVVATLDAVREGVAAFDADHRLTAWNRPFIETLRLPPEMMRVGVTLETLSVAGSASPVAPELVALEARARRLGEPVLTERRLADGTILEVFQNPAADGGFVITCIDVTARRQAEDIARQAQKLDSLGKMTGGIAHDFNNLLTVIVGNLDLLRRAVGQDTRAQERVELLSMAASRGAKLTSQLLAFARRQPLEPQVLGLSQLMPDVVQLVRRAVGETITVESVVAGGLWNTMIDPTQFQTAVLNLAINARDAMPGGGRLTIEVLNASLDDAYASRHAEVTAGQYVLCAVTDTGIGMDADTVAHALDPFFTTKGPDKGTGLGLSMVYGFVKQSGGHLKIYSEPGEGTTVKLYLPRASATELPLPARRETVLAAAGTESVLMVDDDEIVRTTTGALLEDLGYRVTQAASGAEALSLIEKGGRFDLLFTDVVMPGPVNGRALANRAVELDPDLRVLFTSGYTANAVVHNARLDRDVQLISKPFTRESLAAKLRVVLDAHVAPRGAERTG
jgi:signal transduction histidine kinase/ActR/RegA family two-component response regulator